MCVCGGGGCNYHQIAYVNHQPKSTLYKHLQYVYPDFFSIFQDHSVSHYES